MLPDASATAGTSEAGREGERERDTRTPLALAILNLLFEQPLHPYEMQQRMRERGHDRVIHLHGSSLYSTIQRLERAGLIAVHDTAQVGRRPPRTIYALTPAGRAEQHAWLRELLAVPQAEYPWFGAALAFIAAVPPDDARGLLAERAERLATQIGALETQMQAVAAGGLPALFLIEDDFRRAVWQAEHDWLRSTLARIDDGQLTWPDVVLQLQAAARQTEQATTAPPPDSPAKDD